MGDVGGGPTRNPSPDLQTNNPKEPINADESAAAVVRLADGQRLESLSVRDVVRQLEVCLLEQRIPVAQTHTESTYAICRASKRAVEAFGRTSSSPAYAMLFPKLQNKLERILPLLVGPPRLHVLVEEHQCHGRLAI